MATSPKKSIDVLGQKVGGIYAKALYGAAERQGQVDAIIAELQSLVTDVLDTYPDFALLLDSRMIAAEEKLGVVQRVLAGRASPLMLNFLRVLVKNDRLGYLRSMLDALIDLHDQRRGRVRVTVTTATTLVEGRAAQVKDGIRAMLGREPVIVPHVDPNLIGGVQVRVGDTVYDGSVATKLQQLRTRLRQRNVEEIETNRERFQFTESTL